MIRRALRHVGPGRVRRRPLSRAGARHSRREQRRAHGAHARRGCRLRERPVTTAAAARRSAAGQRSGLGFFGVSAAISHYSPQGWRRRLVAGGRGHAAAASAARWCRSGSRCTGRRGALVRSAAINYTHVPISLGLSGDDPESRLRDQAMDRAAHRHDARRHGVHRHRIRHQRRHRSLAAQRHGDSRGVRPTSRRKARIRASSASDWASRRKQVLQ